MAEIKYPIELDDNTTLRENFIDDEDDVLAEDQNNQAKVLKALERKVGINNSTDESSLDYLVQTAVADITTLTGDLENHANAQNPHAGSASIEQLSEHTNASNPHSGSASTTDLDSHAGASNPHAGSASKTEVDAHTGNAGLHFHDHDHSGSGVEGGYIETGGGSSIPTGGMIPFGGDVAPTGYLLCDGSLVSKVTYATLYAVIADKYGTGDTDNFRLPDKRDRVSIGASATKAVGSKGGSETINIAHSHTVNSHSHTVANHTHGVGSDGNHTHGAWANASGDRADYYRYSPDGYTEVHDNHGHSVGMNGAGAHSHGGATGGSAPGTDAQTPGTNSQLSSTQSILPKYEADNWIIKT